MWNGVKCNFSSAHHQDQKIVGNLSIRRVRIRNFTRLGPKTKKLWLSINPARRLFEQPSLGTPPKGVNCNFSSPEFDNPYGVRKLSISDTEIRSFSRVGQKIKKLLLFQLFGGKFGKISLDWALWCGFGGSTIFLCRRSTCRMWMESYRLADLNYAFFRRTGRKTKKLLRSKLFLWTVLKHGLLEGLTILLQYSAITRTPLERSQLGELKYAISPR